MLWNENEVFGDVITYISLEPATKSYQVLEDSVLFKIDIARFRALFEINIEISNMARIMVERYILKQESEKNVTEIRLLSKDFRYLRPDLIYRVKSIHIASFLNMTPETFSRAHSEWTRKNS